MLLALDRCLAPNLIALVTYDRRMADAACGAGLPVAMEPHKRNTSPRRSICSISIKRRSSKIAKMTR